MRISRSLFPLFAAVCLIGSAAAQENIEPALQHDHFPTGNPELADVSTDGIGALSSSSTLFLPLSAYTSYLEEASRFGLGFTRFRPRGYDPRYGSERYAGLRLSDWFRGTQAWNATGGLSNIGTLSTENQIPFSIGSTAERAVLPWQQTRGGRVGASTSNRSYTHRTTIGYNTGESAKNGWAASLFASRGWGQSYAIDGVWSDSWALFGSVSKRLGSKNRLALTVLYAPTQRAIASASTAEAFALVGTNLYNPAWGDWGGRQRSANERESHQPILILNHELRPNERLSITTTAAARFGTESYSDLTWQNAPNPRPDYYRHLPSFQISSQMQERVTQLWQTELNVRQIDWQGMVNLNTVAGKQAHYIVEDRVRNYLEYTLQSVAQWRPTDQTVLSGGVELLAADNLNYKRLNDLLGAEYWLDIDTFAENAEDTRNRTQNNLRDPNRQVHVGEEFGYKYTMENLAGRAWARVVHNEERFDVALTVSGGAVSYQRFGYYEKENFPGAQSYRYSDRLTRPEWLATATIGYRLGGRWRAAWTILAQSLAATPRNSFISPEYRNAVLPELKNEQILGTELRLDYRTPGVRLYAAAFWTQFNDRTDVRYFYDDLNHYFCNYLMEGIDTRHAGLELSVEVQLLNQLWLRGAGVAMDNRYTSNPFATELRESTGEEALTERVYYQNLHVANGPQTAGVISLEYTPRTWIFRASLNAFANSYIAPTPLRRTLRALNQASTPEERAQMQKQEELTAGATADLFLGKTFYLRREQRLGLYAGISNLFNRQDIRTGGYESSRMRYTGEATDRQLTPLDSKYYYSLGINFFVTATWRF